VRPNPRFLRSDPAIRRIAGDWRRLGELAGAAPAKGGDDQRRTLIACSGGGDSSGLAIALAAALSRPDRALALAHIVHDLRPAEEALADRDAAAALAEALGLPFVEGRIRVRDQKGNIEALARRARYRALARIARRQGCPLVATAHSASDQAETVLMALARGSGPRGLGGIHEHRPLSGGAHLIRPALAVPGQELRAICHRFGWEWREDRTNRDLTRARAALRQALARLPALRARSASINWSARLARESAAIVESLARELLAAAGRTTSGGLVLSRAGLRERPAVILGEVLRQAQAALCGRGADRLGERSLAPLIRAIQGRSTEPRRFRLGPLAAALTARTLTLEAACPKA
jgi:tRNA(Ile)-lysidine synthase